MPVSGTAMANSLNALRLYSRRVDQAASRISSVGLFAVPPEQTQEAAPVTSPPAAAEPADWATPWSTSWWLSGPSPLRSGAPDRRRDVEGHGVSPAE